MAEKMSVTDDREAYKKPRYWEQIKRGLRIVAIAAVISAIVAGAVFGIGFMADAAERSEQEQARKKVAMAAVSKTLLKERFIENDNEYGLENRIHFSKDKRTARVEVSLSGQWGDIDARLGSNGIWETGCFYDSKRVFYAFNLNPGLMVATRNNYGCPPGWTPSQEKVIRNFPPPVRSED